MIVRLIAWLVVIVVVLWILGWVLGHAALVPVVILGCGIAGWRLRKTGA